MLTLSHFTHRLYICDGLSTLSPQGLNSGLQLLQRAFVAEPSHPGVLCVLSHFSLFKGMYEEVRGRGGLGLHRKTADT